jgi:hypothetical protein
MHACNVIVTRHLTSLAHTSRLLFYYSCCHQRIGRTYHSMEVSVAMQDIIYFA